LARYKEKTRNKERFCVFQPVPYCEFRLYYYTSLVNDVKSTYFLLKYVIALVYIIYILPNIGNTPMKILIIITHKNLPISQYVCTKVPHARVKAFLAHGVVRLEEGPERVRLVTGGQF